MSSTNPDIVPENAETRRSFRLGVINGALYQAGEGFIDSNTVIPVLLSRLTVSNALIGFASSLTDLGWLLPQFLVTPWLARYPRQLWLYRRAAVVRGLAVVVLAALAFPVLHHPRLMLPLFLVLYAVYSFGAGASAVSFMEVVGKTVPRRRLGSFWSLRLFWGGTLAAAAGFVVREVLRVASEPMQYVILFGTAGVLVSVGFGLFGLIREPAGHADTETASRTPLQLLGDGVRMLGDHPPFRHLLLSRASLAAWLTASPFMVLFAVRDLGGGARTAGTFLLVRITGNVLLSLAWQPLARRHGSRALMRTGSILVAAATALAAAAGAMSPWWLGWLPAGSATLALEAAVFAGGAAQSAILIGYGSLLIELAPEGRRHSFVGLTSTFLGPFMFLPMLGGALVDLVNAPVVFALCAVAALAGHQAARRLPDTRVPDRHDSGEGADSLGHGAA
jgi:Na+/melibiose symporter-like transporter